MAADVDRCRCHCCTMRRRLDRYSFFLGALRATCPASHPSIDFPLDIADYTRPGPVDHLFHDIQRYCLLQLLSRPHDRFVDVFFGLASRDVPLPYHTPYPQVQQRQATERRTSVIWRHRLHHCRRCSRRCWQHCGKPADSWLFCDIFLRNRRLFFLYSEQDSYASLGILGV